MQDLLTKLAYSGSPSRNREGDISFLGKRAAKAFLEKEADSLDEAVAGIAKEEGLSSAQIRQVATAANQATWRGGFHDTGDGNFQFEPVNADAVISSLSDGVEGVREPSLDYYTDPVGEKAMGGQEQLAEAFKVENPEPEYPMLVPHEGELAMQEKVASAADFIRSRVDEIEAALRDEGEELYGMLKQAHLQESVGVLQLCKVASAACIDQEFAADLMKTVAARLEGEGVHLNKAIELQKMAQVLIPDTEHPIYKKFEEFEKLARAFAFRSDQYDDYRIGSARMTELLASRLRTR